MDYLGYVTAAAAFGGLALGVFNTWKSLIEEKVKLRITATLGKRVDEIDSVNVNIVNMSKFPVAVSGIELAIKNGHLRSMGRQFLIKSGNIDARRNLQMSFWLQGQHGVEDVQPQDVESCVVRTECGIERRVAITRPADQSRRR